MLRVAERVMRIIGWVGYCREVGESTYRANQATMQVCTPGMRRREASVRYKARQIPFTHLHSADSTSAPRLSTPSAVKCDAQAGRLLPNPARGSGLKDPMEYTFGLRFCGFFAINKEHRQAFDDYMAARRQSSQAQWFDVYLAEQRMKAHPGKMRETALFAVSVVGKGMSLSNSMSVSLQYLVD